MKTKILLILMLPVLALFSCIKETIQLNDVSREIEAERSFAMPLLKTALTFGDFSDQEYDGLEIINTDTVKLYFIEDIGYEDTVDFAGIPFDFKDIIIEYAYLHHSSYNMLPVGLRLSLIMYNDSLGENIDTVAFGDATGEFLRPAPNDDNGLAIESQVETIEGSLSFDQGTIDNLFGNTTHLIISGEVPQTDTLIKILDYYTISLNLGISAKIRFTANLDSIADFFNSNDTSNYAL
ncbi:MAG: hypothetical protein JW801_08525 [Bacteroidales bacterium]|nr:hypothetical protein [Bacteroidales bacterium]